MNRSVARCGLSVGVVALFAGLACAQQPRVIYSNILADNNTSFVPGMGGLQFKSAASGGVFGETIVSPNGQHYCFTAKINGAGTTADEFFLTSIGGVVTVPLIEGSPFTGTGALVGENLGVFRGYGINNSGQWAVANNTTAASTQDEIIIRGGDLSGVRVALREGDPHPAWAGEFVGALLDGVNVMSDGTIAYWNSAISGTTGGTAKNGWFMGTTTLARADDVAFQPAAQQVLPAQTWDNFSNSFRVASDGITWTGLGDLNGATGTDNIAVLNNTVVLQEGQQLPGVVAGSLINGPASSQSMIRCGRLGRWIARGKTADDFGYIVVNGSIIVREGDNVLGNPLEQYTGTGTSVGSADPTSFRGIAMNNLGDYVVNALTNDVNGDTGVVILNNQRIIVRRGVTTIGVDPLLGPAKLGRIGDTNIGDDMFLTDDGLLYFNGELTGAATGGTLSCGFMVVRAFCGLADVAGLGGTVGRDGQLSVDDIVVFLGHFFAGDLRADCAGLGGTIGQDGALSVDDIVVFLNAFFAGCA